MAAERVGIVFHEGARVGRLDDRDGRIHLTYDEGWRAAVSLSLPVQPGALDAHAFFAGLLPEGMARARVCRQLRVAPTDDFGLLLAIGRDAAGALTVRAEGDETADDEPVELDPDALRELVASQGQRLPRGRPRFSLAGAQDKVAIRRDGDRLFLPTEGEPSSHILKFETIRWVCFAEWAGHDLARRVGLAVPTTEYASPASPDRPCLFVERYDRHPGEGRRRRLHQEDITQALGLPSSQKYQQDGGPTLGAVAKLIREHVADPIHDIIQLRDWQLLNYLMGNYDAHAKNVSLLYPTLGATPELAPFYDLVCLEFLDRIGIHFSRELAFFVGERSIPEEIRRDDWRALAKAIGAPPRRLLSRLEELAAALPDLARETRAAFAEQHGDNPVYDRFEEVIADRCRWTLGMVR